MKTFLNALWPLLIGTGALLGLAIPMAKLAARHGVSALDFALWPTLLAALLLMANAAKRHGLPRQWSTLTRFGLWAGALGYALPMSLAFYLSNHAGAGFAALAFTLPPLCTLGISLALGLEAWRWQRALAVLVGLLGALVLVWARLQGCGWDSAQASTVLLLLVIPCSIGAGNIYRSRFLPAGVANEWLGAAMLLGAALTLLPVRALSGLDAPFLTARAVSALGLQTVTMALGYVLYFRLQRVAEPVSFSFLGYMMSLTGILLGALLFQETLPWYLLPALALILSGFWMTRRSPPAPAAAKVVEEET